MKLNLTAGRRRWYAPARNSAKYAEVVHGPTVIEIHRRPAGHAKSGAQLEDWDFTLPSGLSLTLVGVINPGYALSKRAEEGVTVRSEDRSGRLLAVRSLTASERRVSLQLGEESFHARRSGRRTVVQDRHGAEVAVRSAGEWQVADSSELLLLFLAVLVAVDLNGYLQSPLWNYLF